MSQQLPPPRASQRGGPPDAQGPQLGEGSQDILMYYVKLYQELHENQRQLAHRVEEVYMMHHDVEGMGASIKEILNELPAIRQLKVEVERNMLLRAETANLKTDIAAVKQHLQMDQGGTAQLSDSVKSVQRAHDALKEEIKHAHNQASQEVQSKLQDLNRELQESKNRLRAPSAEGGAAEINKSVMDLRKELYDKGVLHPIREVTPESQAHQPVGTLELDEDIFTTRLLIRLGCMKAEKKALAVSSDDSDSTECCQTRNIAAFDDANVSGIQIPEFEDGGCAHWAVTTGFSGICVCTFLMQFFIIFVLYKYGKDEGAGCVNHPLTDFAEFMLLSAKMLAIICTGTFMCKDIMDVVKYWMVSELVEGRHNKEVIFSASLRITSDILLGFANVIIYNALDSPALIFINMCALSFVGQLGEMVLAVAKRGVFGHAICKTITSLNYALTFESTYPAWFKTIHTLTIVGCVIFSSVFAWLAVSSPIQPC